MVRVSKLILLLVVLATLGNLQVFAGSEGAVSLYVKGNKFYTEEKYNDAIISYEAALKLQFTAPELLYNLGNSYYKTGNYAAAILNYERALKLAPGDPDIEHNLRIVNLHTVDKIDPLPQVFYEKWIDSFVYGAKPVRRAVIGLVLLWLGLGALVAWLFVTRVRWKKITFLAATLLLSSAVVTVVLTWRQHVHRSTHLEAVIFAESAYIKSSPDEKSSNLFRLHSGTKVQVLDELRSWKKVRIANGNEGWIAAADVEGI
jgi:tetratricopeptide (TPR) repeat protein